MSALLFLAAVALITWYAWPAAATWKARGCTFVLAFWLPLLSWPWLVWRGVRARRERAAQKRLGAEAAARERQIQSANWWLAELTAGLSEGDPLRWGVAFDVLQGMSLHRDAERVWAQLRLVANVLVAAGELRPENWPSYRDADTGVRYTQKWVSGGRLTWVKGDDVIKVYDSNLGGMLRVHKP